MVKFDSLLRLGAQKIKPNQIEVNVGGRWLKIVSVYASPGGGRMWAKAGEEMASFHFDGNESQIEDTSNTTHNLSLKDRDIRGYRGPNGIKLLSEEDTSRLRGDPTPVHVKTFPPCAESVIVMDSEEKPVSKAKGIKMAFGGDDG